MKLDNAAPLEQFRRRLNGVHRIAWRPCDIQRIAARFGLIERDVETVAFAVPRIREVRSTARSTDDASPDYRFTISSPTLDRMNDSIDIKGWHLVNYRRNPVVLFSHNSSELPVGRSPAVWIEGEKLKATATFAPSAANPLAEHVRRMIDGRFLVACSVGFMPINWEFTKDPARPFGINFLEQELLEWSICSVPANPDALIDNQQTGKSAAVRRRERDLDVLRMRGA